MYSLNSIDLSTYSIVPGRLDGNIAVKGCFDFPARIGDCYHLWAESDEIEPYTDADDLMYGGRDIFFEGHIFGNEDDINYQLYKLQTQINAFTGLVVFSCPYGNFSVYVENIENTFYHGACTIKINMREPVVTLTGGTLPDTAQNDYQIDGIPFSSFGFYLSKHKGAVELASLQTQYYTKYGLEGFQIVKRNNKELVISGFIMGSSINDFNSKIKNLYLIFSSSGNRVINIGYMVNTTCFSMDGFTVSNVYVCNNLVIGEISIPLKVISASYFYYLADEGGNLITDENSNKIII